jgi:HTH-type transcriptional regulator/antitoxin HigA
MSEENGNPAVKSPGEMVRTELKTRGWTQDDLAKIIGKPRPRINELIQGKLTISSELAAALGAAFGMDAAIWMQAEAAYRLSLANPNTTDVERRAKLFSLAPIKDMEKRGWIRRTDTIEELESELKRFFGTADLTLIPELSVSTRRTTTQSEFMELSPSQRVWCFRAHALASEQVVSRYDPEKFESCVKELRPLTAFAPQTRKVSSILTKYGIRFVVIEPLASSKIDGAAFWVGDDKPAIAMSLRFDRIDGFWHTLCHELSHIRHQDPLSIDTALVGEDAVPSALKQDFEERADIEAANTLISQDKLDSFVRRIAPLYAKEKIIQFAHVIKVHPGIIVGQLQYRGEIGYHANRDLLVKVRQHVISGSIVDGWGHTTT